MKKIILLFLVISCSVFTKGQTVNPAHQWFSDARFGMFIHFGPYSVLGNGEWVMQNRPVKVKEYKKLQQFFNPEGFDAKAWVKTAKDAGARYITFTSRHHDGYSMWNTKYSDWNIMNSPHFGRDLLKELSDECKREKIKLILYYSLIDWSRNDYQYWTGSTGQGCGRTEKGNWSDYIQFMKDQLTELLTQYEIAGIWFDGDWDQHPQNSHSHVTSKVDWHYTEIYGLIHKLRPDAMICNNHHKNPIEGEDYQAFERDFPGENKAGYSDGQKVSELLLETCETMNRTWGYSITDDRFKSTTELIHFLVKAAGNGANLLLNVGPMPNGEIQTECVTRLKEMGEWLGKYGETIYGTKAGFIKSQQWGAVTQKGNKLYIHILDSNSKQILLHLPQGTNYKSVKWYNLNDKTPEIIPIKQTEYVLINLEKTKLDVIDSIIEITL